MKECAEKLSEENAEFEEKCGSLKM